MSITKILYLILIIGAVYIFLINLQINRLEKKLQKNDEIIEILNKKLFSNVSAIYSLLMFEIEYNRRKLNRNKFIEEYSKYAYFYENELLTNGDKMDFDNPAIFPEYCIKRYFEELDNVVKVAKVVKNNFGGEGE